MPYVTMPPVYIRVEDIQVCYELWRGRGVEFITEPKDKVWRDTLLHPRS